MNTTHCPQCTAENAQDSLLGVLGTVAHLRCRYCGWNYTVPAEELDLDEEFANED